MPIQNSYGISVQKKILNISMHLQLQLNGMGELGYNDDVSPEELQKLRPLNKYGYSKKFFDDWAFKQESQPNNGMG